MDSKRFIEIKVLNSNFEVIRWEVMSLQASSYQVTFTPKYWNDIREAEHYVQVRIGTYDEKPQ